MNLPIIFSIDDDESVLRAITRDLKSRYYKEYRILSTTSVQEALTSLVSLKNKGETVAIFISDQRMPEMEGVDFLTKTLSIFPEAKRILLTAYADTEAAIKAINEAGLDYYLSKPWDPPQEKLFPVIDDLLDDWKSDYRPDFSGVKVVGFQYSPKAHEIKTFLTSYLVPFLYLDMDSEEGKQLLTINNIDVNLLPAVIYADGIVVTSPSILEIAGKIGLSSVAKSEVYDVAIIGAGPAGLAASVYGASEGLKTLLIERKSPGGQAGTSSRIENYLGFPTGLSGSDLTRRALTQSARFGTEFLTPQSVKGITFKDGYKLILLDDETTVTARSVVVTTGVDYRKLDTTGVADFTGAGIYYGASTTEAAACSNKYVYVVGGGNSAGQSAMYLSKFARHVYILIRKEDLSSTMSAYLINQLKQVANISIKSKTEIKEAKGDKKLQQLVLENLDTRESETVDAGALYIFIGAKPYTDWLSNDILKDERGFIETGSIAQHNLNFKKYWKLKRDPFLLETSCPGIFAAGDVRAGAMNRVASAVGEGSMAISFVHKYLADI